MSSNIAAIVDYSAWRAATSVQNITNPLTGELLDIASVYGAGQDLYPDPTHPGQMIQPAPEKPLEPFQHVSDLPDAPTVTTWTQDVLVELEWTVPMRLYVARGDLRTLRGTLLPFYDAYLAAFWRDYRLGGDPTNPVQTEALCQHAYIRTLRVEADDDWGWLYMELAVLEEVAWP